MGGESDGGDGGGGADGRGMLGSHGDGGGVGGWLMEDVVVVVDATGEAGPSEEGGC